MDVLAGAGFAQAKPCKMFKREFSDDVRDYVGAWKIVFKLHRTKLWRRAVGKRTGDPLFF